MTHEAKNSAKAGKTSIPASIRGFFAGVKSEFSKIIFPKPREVRKEAIAAIIVSVIIGILIFGLDTLFTELLGLIL